MVRQTPDLRAVEFHLNNFVGVGQPAVGWNRIARHIAFSEKPAAVVRRGNVNAHAPICSPKARLLGVGEPDFNHAGFAIRLRLRVTTFYPHEHFIAVEIRCDIHVTAGMGELPLEVHVPVEQLHTSKSSTVAV